MIPEALLRDIVLDLIHSIMYIKAGPPYICAAGTVSFSEEVNILSILLGLFILSGNSSLFGYKWQMLFFNKVNLVYTENL